MLVNPFAVAPVLPIGEALIVALISGLATATILPKAPLGFVVALVALVALVVPRGRTAFAVLVPGLVAVAAAYVVVEQATKHFTAAGWTNHFEAASVAVWTAVALLAADVVAELVVDPGVDEPRPVAETRSVPRRGPGPSRRSGPSGRGR